MNRRPRPDGRRSIGRLVGLYLLAGLGAFVLCGVGLALAERHAALRESVRDAEVTTTLLATRVVEPALPTGRAAELQNDEAFDTVIRERVLVEPMTRVEVVDENGLVLYASEAGLAGQRQPLSADERTALRAQTSTARQDDGSDPVRLTGGRSGHSLDVSVGMRSTSGEPLLLQSRQPYDVVWLTSRAVWLTLVPSIVSALALLYLVKAGFAFRLALDLHKVQDEREQLLVSTLAAADRERTLIASDLHDGVVQGLAGASLTLSDASWRTREAGLTSVADTLAETAGGLRQWVRELRSLIVTVTPPALHSEGLQAALSDLVATLEARGIGVQLDVRTARPVSETAESLVYRVAQESIRNIVRHAHASNVELRLVEDDDALQLRVSDDGQGFDPSSSARRQGSVGLDLLAALVDQRGGNLRVESALGEGTAVTLRLPDQVTTRVAP